MLCTHAKTTEPESTYAYNHHRKWLHGILPTANGDGIKQTQK
ncbi:hypothetical protein [Hoylesella shahii]|nr:hypothetical protein [Hoylesella shahii]